MKKTNNLRELRERKGLSQSALATEAGSSPATIVNIEKNGFFPGEGVQRRIAKALGVEISAIWPHLDKTQLGEDQ